MAITPLSKFSQALDRAHRLDGEGPDTPAVETLITAANRMNGGGVASARLVMSAQPADTNSVTIGADVYRFLAAGTDLTTDTDIAVLIGADAAATQQNLIDAINATDADNEHASLLQSDGATPALANGTENLFADAVGTSVRIRTADAPGGVIMSADPSIVLAEAITDAADVWQPGNVNMNTLSGRAAGAHMAVVQMTVTAAMIALDQAVFSFDFVPEGFAVLGTIDSSGNLQSRATDAIAIANDEVVIGTFGDGAAPDFQDDDVVTILAWGSQLHDQV